jgi:hypothetical protein
MKMIQFESGVNVGSLLKFRALSALLKDSKKSPQADVWKPLVVFISHQRSEELRLNNLV